MARLLRVAVVLAGVAAAVAIVAVAPVALGILLDAAAGAPHSCGGG